MNQLHKASSPYLLQHANNPVYWHEWSEETLEKAQQHNKPLFISIGYAACHWCHVMARESFSNEEVATLLNEYFICIKIDREERPDIDQVYMDALHTLKGSGGWPLSAFALPNGKPFYAGTYYPVHQFISAIKQLHHYYENSYLQVVEQALKITNDIKKSENFKIDESQNSLINKQYFNLLFNTWNGRIDYLRGGFGSAPKFPLAVGWQFVLEYYKATKKQDALKAVNNTLTAMADGGIFDHIGGGFARYSVDAYWRVPHFEKMLYDNGQLVSLYANAYLIDKNPIYKKTIVKTLDFISELLTDENGGFYASLNADSEGEEGAFYVFTKNEITTNFSEEIAHFIINYFHFSDEGNWEHQKNTLFTTYTFSSYAAAFSKTLDEVTNLYQQAISELYNYRKQRIHPTTDTKILTGWNALMLMGYLDSYIALENKTYLEIALKNAHFIKDNLIKSNSGIYRNFKNNKASINGFLEDYALFAEALIKLYQTTFNVEWLHLSKQLVDYSISHFYDESKLQFAFTSDEDPALYIKKYELFDNVIPSSNAVMATVLYQLGLFYDNPTYTSISTNLLNQMLPHLTKSGPYTAKWASLVGTIANGSQIIAIVGVDALNFALKLQQKNLNKLLICGGTNEHIPYLTGKSVLTKTVIYICQNNVCSNPMFSVDEVQVLLDNSYNHQ
ncbi:MAG: thioredoxin domain-containing protein [Bacteroidetes bacterium]|nr:thioredoxin domain-containing protein [Bacteroidota bacterium]